MTVVMTNCVAIGNGGAGLQAPSDAQLELNNFQAIDNAGGGIVLTDPKRPSSASKVATNILTKTSVAVATEIIKDKFKIK